MGIELLPAALDAAHLRRWVQTAQDRLADRRGDLDSVNVFPVADSDTGTNLLLTLTEAAAAASAAPPGSTTAEVAAALVRGALVGARGSSGVIVAEYLRALVGGVVPTDGGGSAVGPQQLAAALARASDAAYDAVGDPVEGTVLTVARAVAAAAEVGLEASAGAGTQGAVGTPTTVEVLEAAVVQGYEALRRTTAQLPALAAAGVVDAGAWGLLLVLDALAHCLGGEGSLERSRQVVRAQPAPECGASTCVTTTQAHGAPPAVTGPEFEVMYLVSAAPGLDGTCPDLAATLRAALSLTGGSVAVVGGDGLWQVHVHTDDPLLALDAAPAGSVSQVRVRHLGSQAGVHGSHRPTLGLVAVTRAPGLVPDLARAGAVVVLGDPGPELDRAVEDTGAAEVLVLSAATVGRPMRQGVVVAEDLSEVQVVCGAATTAASVHGGGSATALLEHVLAAVRGVRTAVVPAVDGDVGGDRQAERVTGTARELLEDGMSLLTAVTSAATPPAAVEGLRATGALPADVEVVVLAGAGHGADIVLGAE